MREVNNKGFSKTELIVVLTAIIILFAIAVGALSNNVDKGKISTFKKLANSFAHQISMYKDNYINDEGLYYLDDVLKNNYKIDLTNPFSEEACDRYESYVLYGQMKKEVNLRCGDYLATNSNDDDYTIYKVSAWSKEKVKGEEIILYNYKKDNKVVLDNYVIEKEFIETYNLNEKDKISDVLEVSKENQELLADTFYRTKEEVK